ncbi:MAG: endonuclease/exonuclease/phosphatase family protein [Muribaculaceae bacterium]|nr:endonuclease/exonuclease/phosphatase family protein [Muribaculaceae bacterium]
MSTLLGKILSPFVVLIFRIFSLIVFLLTIIAAFGGRINPDYLTFPSLLNLAFPYLAILTIVVTIGWIIAKKIVFCTLGIVTIIICLTPLSVAFPIGSKKVADTPAKTFKIISWNVLHTNDLRQPDYPGNRAVEFMVNSGADIICLTELFNFSEYELKKITQSLNDSLCSIYPYRLGDDSSDIKLISKYPASRIGKIRKDEDGICRYDFFKIDFPDNTLVVAMVHLYSYGLSEQERQVVTEIKSVESAKTSMQEFKGSIREKLRKAFRKRAEDATLLREEIDDISENTPLIVCGDFNDVPTSWAYDIIRGDDMHDAYVETNFGPAITYNLHAFYFHIDQMLYRGPLTALSLDIGKINSSDHYPLIGEFEFTE